MNLVGAAHNLEMTGPKVVNLRLLLFIDSSANQRVLYVAFKPSRGTTCIAIIMPLICTNLDTVMLHSLYQVMRSGVPNFCAVALALNDLGYVQRFTYVLVLYLIKLFIYLLAYSLSQ